MACGNLFPSVGAAMVKLHIAIYLSDLADKNSCVIFLSTNLEQDPHKFGLKYLGLLLFLKLLCPICKSLQPPSKSQIYIQNSNSEYKCQRDFTCCLLFHIKQCICNLEYVFGIPNTILRIANTVFGILIIIHNIVFQF